jgi:hypothetical protein
MQRLHTRTNCIYFSWLVHLIYAWSSHVFSPGVRRVHYFVGKVTQFLCGTSLSHNVTVCYCRARGCRAEHATDDVIRSMSCECSSLFLADASLGAPFVSLPIKKILLFNICMDTASKNSIGSKINTYTYIDIRWSRSSPINVEKFTYTA